MAFVRFINKNEIVNQFLFCKELSVTTKGEDIFNILNNYLDKCQLSWKWCVGICADEAPSMVGCIKGLVAFIKKKNENVIVTHCFLYREALMSRTLGKNLREVLDEVVKMVNFTKTRPAKSRVFEKNFANVDSQHKQLLLHTDVRWLSKGKVLTRVHELRYELLAFFKAVKQSHFCNLLKRKFWIAKLQYLKDIFQHLNILSTNMQGKEKNIFTSTDKTKAFQRNYKFGKAQRLKVV